MDRPLRAAGALLAALTLAAAAAGERTAAPAESPTLYLRDVPAAVKLEAPRTGIGSLATATLAAAPRVGVREAAVAALSPDAARVVTLRAPAEDGEGTLWSIVTWDVESGVQAGAVMLGEDEEPSTLAFRADGARLAVSLAYAPGVVIDLDGSRVVGRFGSEGEDPERAVFTPDGSGLLVATAFGVESWDATRFERRARVETLSPFKNIDRCGDETKAEHCADVWNVSSFVSPAGTFFVQSSGGRVMDPPFELVAKQIHLYGRGDLAVRCHLPLDEYADVGPFAFSADDRLFAFVPNIFAGPEPSVVVIDTGTCKPPEGAGTDSGPGMFSAQRVVVSAANLLALVMGDAYTAELWAPKSLDPPTVGLAHVLDSERSQLTGAAFSRDGTRVALFGTGGRLQTFDTATGKRLSVVSVASDGQNVKRVEFLPDGTRALVALRSRGSQAALVETTAGRVLRRFE